MLFPVILMHFYPSFIVFLSTVVIIELVTAQSLPSLQNGGELIYSIVLFRHGDREPGKLPPGIENTNNWTTADSELNQAGMRRSYRLGQFLRLRYKDFLPEQYIKNDLYVRSSNEDRTLMTASSLLAGLYPPKGKQKWHPDINWQPIPVHTKLLHEDPRLKPSKYECPNIDSWRKENDDMVWKRLSNDTKWHPLVTFLTNNVSPYYKNLKKVRKLFNSMFEMKNRGSTWPKWMNDTLMEQITAAKNLYYRMQHDDQIEHKLGGGILTGDILKNIKDKVNKTLPEKLRLYSSHAGTLTPQLLNLGIYNGVQPPYSAALLFEVYRVPKTDDGPNDHYVSVFYRNETDTVETPLYSMILPDCHPRECTLQKFEQSLAGKYFKNEDKLADACGRKDSDSNSSSSSSDDDDSSL